MNEGDQLRQFIDNQPKSKISIARALGVSKQTLFQYFKSKQLTAEIKKRFEDYFDKEIFTEGNTFHDPAESYLDKRRNIKNAPKEIFFPVYEGNTKLREDDQLVVYSDDPEMQIPVGYLPQHLFPGCDHAEKCTGNSMWPRIANQGVAIGKIIDKNKVVSGEMYGMHIKGGSPPIVKYVQKTDDKNTFKIISENEAIRHDEIAIDDITFMYRVLYVINPA